MKRSHLAAGLVGLAAALAAASEPAAPAPRPQPAAAPAHNWVLPVFSDREGHRLMTLRGAEVRPAGEKITIRELMVTVFTGDAAANFSGFTPRTYNWGLSYSRPKYTLRANWNYRGAQRRAAMLARGDKAWKPTEQRKRKVTTALKAYAAMTTSAAKGAVRVVE